MQILVLCNIVVVLLGAISLSSNVGAQSSEIIDVDQLGLALRITSAITSTQANYVISPLNLDFALSAIYDGIGDDRCSAQLRTLMGNVKGTSVNKKRDYIQKYKNSAGTTRNFTLSFLNAIFYDKNIVIMPKYKNKVENLYNTTFGALNFKDKIKASSTINDMISKATRGMITDGVDADSIDPTVKIMSVNVLYFDAAWREPFDERHMQTFYGSDGSKEEIEMMTGETVVDYYESTDYKFKLISKPYEGNKFQMVLILPYANSTLEDLEKNLLEKPHLIDDAWRDSYRTEIKVTMPVIMMEETLDMTKVLEAKNISCLFDGGLNKIADQPMSISKMTHKVKFETNETGSRGAAVTTFQVIPLMATTNPEPFIADRPYMFMVVDVDTGFIIFMGKQSKANPINFTDDWVIHFPDDSAISFPDD